MYLIPAGGFSVDLPYIINYGAFNSWGQIGFGICLPPPARKNNNTVYTLRPPLMRPLQGLSQGARLLKHKVDSKQVHIHSGIPETNPLHITDDNTDLLLHGFLRRILLLREPLVGL